MSGKPATRILPATGIAVCLIACGGLACLTPSQTRSVGDQIGAIRRQAEEVRSGQRRNGESIEASSPPDGMRTAGAGVSGGEVPAGGAPLETLPPPAVIAAAPDDRDDPNEAAATGDPSLFREGYALYHRRDYRAAEQRLRLFLAGDPAGPLADDALYWIGECRFARGLYRDAILEYRALIELHPGGNQVPRAHYRIALSHQRLGELAPMRERLSTVIEEYPQSDVAALARDRLASL
jgi:TolA-binding protein